MRLIGKKPLLISGLGLLAGFVLGYRRKYRQAAGADDAD